MNNVVNNFSFHNKMDQQNETTNHPVFKYFNYNPAEDNSYCLIVPCKYNIMKGKHSSNLVRHIQRRHKAEHGDLLQDIGKYQENRVRKVAQKEDTVKVKINKNEIIKGCVELVTINARPFKLLEDCGFRRILDPILAQFVIEKNPFTINEEFIKSESDLYASSVHDKIERELKDKMFSIQIDLVKKFGKPFLGVISQYYVQRELKSRTLALKRLKDSATGLNIALILLNVITDYGSNIDKVYSITSDNGSNVVKCVKIMKIFQEHILDDYLDDDPSVFDATLFEEIVETQLSRILHGDDNPNFLHGIRCAAHTMELSITDAFQKAKLCDEIDIYRNLVKKLRTTNILNIIEQKGLKKPLIDGETRWITSVYRMVYN